MVFISSGNGLGLTAFMLNNMLYVLCIPRPNID